MVKRFWNCYRLFTELIVLAVLTIVLTIGAVSVNMVVHEIGHVSLGSIEGLLYGQPRSFYISNYVNMSIGFIDFKVPQETTIVGAKGGLLFIFGGIILSLLFWGWVGLFLYKKTKKFVYPSLLFVIFLMRELLGNYMCGTDNLSGSKLVVCVSLIDWVRYNILFLLFPLFFLMLYPFVHNLMNKFFKACNIPD